MGLSQCKIIVVGADAIQHETLEYFMAANIPLLEWYGMSESTGPHTANIRAFGRMKIGSCGKSISGVNTKIDNADQHGHGEVSNVK